MAEAILLVLWFGTSLFFIWREIKAKRDRASQEWWLSELRDCLHSIESEFSRHCFEITEKALSQHNYSSYLSQISNLKEEYTKEAHSKIIAIKGKYFLTSLPEYILREYERNLSRIADIYRNILTINR